MESIKERVISDFCDAAFLENFRVMADGTLEGREGFTKAAVCDSLIRGSYFYGDKCYMVAGSSLLCCDGDGNPPSVLGVLDGCTFLDDGEKVFIFEYGRCLHIIGGGCYYVYDIATGSFFEDDYYSPLCRYQHKETGEHISYEDLNIVSSTATVHYLVDEEETKYYLVGLATSVNEVLVDGKPFTNYTYHQNGLYPYILLEHTAYVANKENIVITYTLDESYHMTSRDSLFRNKRGFVTRIEEKVRLFLFDPYDPTGTVYFSELSYDIDKKSRGTFDYFTKDSFFTVGDGATPLFNMGQLSDHVFLFNDDEIYELESRDGTTGVGLSTLKFGCKLTTNDIGISRDSGVVTCDGAMYIIGHRGLFRCSYNKFTYDFISASIEIPKSVIPDMDRYKDVRLFFYRRYDELWLHYDDKIAVYNVRHKKWYLFTGIAVGDFVPNASEAMFSREGELFAFSSDAVTDDGAGIAAVCETTYYGLPSPAKNKTLFTFGVAFDNVSGAELKCTVTNDRGESASATFISDGGTPSVPAVKRIHTKLIKSSLVACRLESVGGKPPANVRAVILRYRETGGRQ